MPEAGEVKTQGVEVRFVRTVSHPASSPVVRLRYVLAIHQPWWIASLGETMSDVTTPSSIPAGWYPEPATGQVRWWDGASWGQYQAAAPVENFIQVAGRPVGNSLAIAALILGIWGFMTTWIPLFIGLVLGGIPDILAIIFGIMGIVRARKIGGKGMPLAVVGLVLGSLAFISIFFGAGTIW